MCVCGGLWVCNFHCVKYGCDFLGPSYLYPVFFSYRDAALRLAWVQEWTFRWWFSERGWCRSIPDVLGLQVMETRKYASEKSGRTNVVIHGLPSVFWWILIHMCLAQAPMQHLLLESSAIHLDSVSPFGAKPGKQYVLPLHSWVRVECALQEGFLNFSELFSIMTVHPWWVSYISCPSPPFITFTCAFHIVVWTYLGQLRVPDPHGTGRCCWYGGWEICELWCEQLVFMWPSKFRKRCDSHFEKTKDYLRHTCIDNSVCWDSDALGKPGSMAEICCTKRHLAIDGWVQPSWLWGGSSQLGWVLENISKDSSWFQLVQYSRDWLHSLFALGNPWWWGQNTKKERHHDYIGAIGSWPGLWREEGWTIIFSQVRSELHRSFLYDPVHPEHHAQECIRQWPQCVQWHGWSCGDCTRQMPTSRFCGSINRWTLQGGCCWCQGGCPISCKGWELLQVIQHYSQTRRRTWTSKRCMPILLSWHEGFWSWGNPNLKSQMVAYSWSETSLGALPISD